MSILLSAISMPHQISNFSRRPLPALYRSSLHRPNKLKAYHSNLIYTMNSNNDEFKYEYQYGEFKHDEQFEKSDGRRRTDVIPSRASKFGFRCRSPREVRVCICVLTSRDFTRTSTKARFIILIEYSCQKYH